MLMIELFSTNSSKQRCLPIEQSICHGPPRTSGRLQELLRTVPELVVNALNTLVRSHERRRAGGGRHTIRYSGERPGLGRRNIKNGGPSTERRARAHEPHILGPCDAPRRRRAGAVTANVPLRFASRANHRPNRTSVGRHGCWPERIEMRKTGSEEDRERAGLAGMRIEATGGMRERRRAKRPWVSRDSDNQH
jgi:hypothetical protein